MSIIVRSSEQWPQLGRQVLVCAGGSDFNAKASSFFDAVGTPPGVGQLFLAFDLKTFGGEALQERIDTLYWAIEQEPGARLPGSRRLANREKVAQSGIAVPESLLRTLEKRAGASQQDPAEVARSS